MVNGENPKSGSPPDALNGRVTEEQFAVWVEELRDRATTGSDANVEPWFGRTGRIIQLGRQIFPTESSEGEGIAFHRILPATTFDEVEPTLHMDRVGFNCHGSELTHVDAPSHVEFRARGTDVSMRPASGVEALGALVVRTVVIDVPWLRGISFMEPGDCVQWSDLEQAQLRCGVTIRPGVGVLIRTGRWARLRLTGHAYDGERRPGVGPETALRLLNANIAILGGDGGNDVRPSTVNGVSFPVHVLALVGAGIPLLDNVDLEELCGACVTANSWEVGLCVSPVRLHGATGMPVNPIAMM